MTYLLSLFFLIPTYLFLPPAMAAKPPAANAEAILKVADRARGGLASGVTWNIEVTSTEKNGLH